MIHFLAVIFSILFFLRLFGAISIESWQIFSLGYWSAAFVSDFDLPKNFSNGFWVVVDITFALAYAFVIYNAMKDNERDNQESPVIDNENK